MRQLTKRGFLEDPSCINVIHGCIGQEPYTDLKWNHKELRRRCQEANSLTGFEGWLVQPYKTERDHLNIEKLTALFVVIRIHCLVYGNVKCDTNILMKHMCANIKKQFSGLISALRK